MTYRELVYMCLDEIKLASDDSYITEDHILFLISKYRAFLLRQKYEKTNMPAPMSNYQFLESVELKNPIPTPMSIAKPEVVANFTLEWPDGDKTKPSTANRQTTYVPHHRFEFVGHNSVLKTIIYCALDRTNVMQFKNLPEEPELTTMPTYTLESYDIYAIFEDCLKASEFIGGEILDQECPIEAELVSGVQELVVKDALGIAYRPTDFINNASDDLSKIGMAAGNSKKQ